MSAFLDIEVNQRIPARSGFYYRVLQTLGSGGNSIVYLVLALDGAYRGVLFALKVFTRISDQDRVKKFEQEIEFLRNCDHPSIMRIYDDGIYQSRTAEGLRKCPFVIAEYLPVTLFDLIRTRTSIAEKLSITLQLLSAITFLASQDPPVIHRDIKPKNIFLKGKSSVLGDFGLIKYGTDAELDRKIFKESLGPGMPFLYRTPDLVSYARQEADLTAKSDVFQLGLVICELFTCRNPCKRSRNLLDNVDLESILDVPGVHGPRIKLLIEEMLIPEFNRRPNAGDLIDPWEGVFREVVSLSHQLEGRVI